MPELYNEITNKWFELANDAYRTYFKTMVWGQEQALEWTKTLIGQSDTKQGKALADEYSAQWKRAQELTQTTWDQMLKNTTEVWNQFRAATNTNIADVNARLDEIQNRLESSVKPGK